MSVLAHDAAGRGRRAARLVPAPAAHLAGGQALGHAPGGRPIGRDREPRRVRHEPTQEKLLRTFRVLQHW
ncbi:MAG TPA: hypothetical protein VNW50_21180 [Streptosporangiaceae bacterium]|nr:hypothetical protein [Streptosporangiaceae bacterium]